MAFTDSGLAWLDKLSILIDADVRISTFSVDLAVGFV